MHEERTWTERITFHSPVLFRKIGRPLPPGTYEFTFQGHETVVNGQPYWQVTNCTVPLPPGWLRDNHPGLDARIDLDELRQRQNEDARAAAQLVR